jgi:hypothetical protein
MSDFWNKDPYEFENTLYIKGVTWPDNVKDAFIADTRINYPGLTIDLIALNACVNSHGSVGQMYALQNPKNS